MIEVSILRFFGALVDMLRATSPAEVFARYRWTFLGMGALILIARPLANFTHDLLTQQAIAPGMTNLIRWQTHRYVLRQSLNYFANDFAGRIASNIVQTAASLRESVVQIIDALWFVAIFAMTALVIFAAGRLALGCPAGAVDRRLSRRFSASSCRKSAADPRRSRMRAPISPAASSTATPTSRR